MMKALTKNEITHAMETVPAWRYLEPHAEAIMIVVSFKDFKEAWSFMTKVAVFMEEMNHHANWANTYNTVSIGLSTHDCNGLSEKDFILARRIDELLKHCNHEIVHGEQYAEKA